MLSRSSVSLLPEPVNAAFVVDLIGDLDAPLVESFAEALERLAPPTGEAVVLRLKHVAAVHPAGAAALGAALRAYRLSGGTVRVVTENGRIRALLRTARIDAQASLGSDRSARLRHVMIARNAKPARDCA